MSKNDSVLSSIHSFREQFPGVNARFKGSKRLSHLERYFAKGGVLSIGSVSNGENWPEITYPTRMKLKKDLEKLEFQKRELEKRMGSWKSKKTQAKWSDLTSEIKKFKEPLFWKHLRKYYTNQDYRKDADSVKLPVKLVSHQRWKPMIEMFVTDLDYRKQLTETVETSVVYAKDKRVARFADQQKAFRLEQSEKNLGLLQKKWMN
ncbi:hypothetical protein KKE06_05625 [Candidatus Micrarchaeota archaeon]|nr:hypothetical protein [Candidatus Micrarchaeota archaeon]MBU1930016.1 hypothetical protein [Candidatus Micrarchaeota archaeon]